MTTADIISIVSVFIAIVSTVVAVIAIKSGNTINNKEIVLQNYEDMKVTLMLSTWNIYRNTNLP